MSVFYWLIRLVLAGSRMNADYVAGTAKVFRYDNEYGLSYDEVRYKNIIMQSANNRLLAIANKVVLFIGKFSLGLLIAVLI